jgi:hypothetical protein
MIFLLFFLKSGSTLGQDGMEETGDTAILLWIKKFELNNHLYTRVKQ